MPALPFTFLTIQRLNRPNLLWFFKSSQRNSFYCHTIRYFWFAKQCVSNNALVFDTMAGNRERRAELDWLDDTGTVTWHLHLLDLRMAAAHTGWWMAACVCRWSSCLWSAPANLVLLHENWDGFHLQYSSSATWNIRCLEEQLFNLVSNARGYCVDRNKSRHTLC